MRLIAKGVGQVAGALDVCDLWPSNDLPPSAFVAISIQPIGECQPDANGNLLHCLVEFAFPAAEYGQRRQTIAPWAPSGQTPQDTIQIECDPGTFRIATDAQVKFLGGVEGDAYEVTATGFVSRDQMDPKRAIDVYEPTFDYELTYFFALDGGVLAMPAWHQYVWVIQGSLLWTAAAIHLTNYGPSARVPTSAAASLGVTRGIYKTGGSL
jgi:hypothetical protein